jgi:hypothetical protein
MGCVVGRRRLFVVAATGLAVGLALPGVSGAQVPTQDSVVLTGGFASAGFFFVRVIDATSGPSGENPTGEVRFDAGGFLFSGPVTCLAVSGNTATINVQDQVFGFGVLTVQVLDGQPDTFDAAPEGRAPTDCSPLPPTGFGGPLSPLSAGDIVVVDAPPLPTSKAQCKNGGWRNFRIFENQGDCVTFVATGGRNPPAGA